MGQVRSTAMWWLLLVASWIAMSAGGNTEVRDLAGSVPDDPSSHFQVSHTGANGDGTRFKLVTDGSAIQGSFEGAKSKDECFRLCLLESRCEGVFISDTEQCNLVNHRVA